jgi:hypothetical protein
MSVMTGSVYGNLSQTLFEQNEQLIQKAPKNAQQQFTLISDQPDSNMKQIMPAFLSQAHLSTYYQDNPWDTLSVSEKYGLPTLGGSLDKTQPPGHRPGNILRKKVIPNKDNFRQFRRSLDATVSQEKPRDIPWLAIATVVLLMFALLILYKNKSKLN